MQLDRTHVVIRLRTLSEIGDLAMVMIRRYSSSLLIGFAAGAAVWAIANALLLSWIPIQEAAYGLDDEEAVAEVSRYMIWMTLLVILQAPAAGVLTTLYLGHAVFERRPTWASVFGEAKRQFRRWMWVLGIKRLAIPAMLLLAVRWGQPLSTFFDIVVPIAIFLTIAVARSSRPFMPEILLLEQCPLRSDSDSVITMARRSKSLHAPMGGELGGRFLAVSFVLFGLLLSVMYTLMWARGITLGQWNFMDLIVLLVLFPSALWIVAGVSVLVRLLSYLDTRIRLEGWEVELAIRAEAMRQFGEDAAEVGMPASSRSPRSAQPGSLAAGAIDQEIMDAIEISSSASSPSSPSPPSTTGAG